eukprot:s608_g21.t1
MSAGPAARSLWIRWPLALDLCASAVRGTLRPRLVTFNALFSALRGRQCMVGVGASWALPLQFLQQMRAGDVQPDMILAREQQWNRFVIEAKSYYKPCARSTETVPGALLWADEFDGNEVNLSNWVQMTGVEEVKDGQLHYTDRRTNSFVENGVLKIVASCEESEMGKYTSAKLSTQNRFHWGPGHRLEIRARVPKGRGLWPAIFMLPSKGGPWPETGEIDIMEVSGCVAGKEEAPATEDWASDHINWYVDGQLYHTARQTSGADGADGPWPFREEFFLNMNMAVNALWASGCHESKALSCEDLGQAMEVDYVRVHELKAASS